MSASEKSTSHRREFLAHVATAAAVMAGTACASPLAAAGMQGASSSGLARTAPFNDDWTRRVGAAKHKAVFDSPGIDDGLALSHATFFMQGYKEQLGVGGDDVVPVVVLRHFGTVMAMNDLLWEKYALGERMKVKDPRTGKDAVRNPFLNVTKDDKEPHVSPEASLEGLLASGAVLLACNKAAMRYAGQMAQKFNRNVEEVRAEIRANIVPGVWLQPSGIYATLRAQDAGCAFLKST
ncbi:MAG: hypothetical protein ABIT20_22180 [Gemmatimonadaceae bacterium]